jgi:hypothetical protein
VKHSKGISSRGVAIIVCSLSVWSIVDTKILICFDHLLNVFHYSHTVIGSKAFQNCANVRFIFSSLYRRIWAWDCSRHGPATICAAILSQVMPGISRLELRGIVVALWEVFGSHRAGCVVVVCLHRLRGGLKRIFQWPCHGSRNVYSLFQLVKRDNRFSSVRDGCLVEQT